MKLHRGECLFRQGEMGSLYRLHTGLLKVVRYQADGQALLFNILLPGELFPHHSLVSPKPYHGNAIAMMDSEVEVINSEDWYHQLEENPYLYREVSLSLQHKLRMMQERIDQLTTVTAKERFNAFIHWFKQEFPDIDPLSIFTQEEISQFMGLRRETLNRLLRKPANFS
ncbi:Crp/Fnr family transcriptional regulator [Alicyclobacillus tolerans]|uniref:Crp/Fnr family transcriptional regulator n=1 Tax=Alicyclobacillus TaxID=29330 RepID=UPI000934BBF0|nr:MULTISPECIES: Crp/Fnr family transcriptional regulator [Alicyclobacillus]QRF24587.1 Crp/Fnr family transcriptional regulator [Alicyclobacillus sp. TC]